MSLPMQAKDFDYNTLGTKTGGTSGLPGQLQSELNKSRWQRVSASGFERFEHKKTL